MIVNSLYHQTSNNINQELIWIRNSKKNPNNFSSLYNKYYDQIYRYVNHKICDRQLTDDITSQVFIKAMNNIHKYEYRGVPFSSWLYRIAKSEIYQSFRNRKSSKLINFGDMNLFSFVTEKEENQSNDNKIRLMNSLKSLKSKDLNIIELRYFERRSYREIGTILKITENNAKVKSYRALRRLKKIFLEK